MDDDDKYVYYKGFWAFGRYTWPVIKYQWLKMEQYSEIYHLAKYSYVAGMFVTSHWRTVSFQNFLSSSSPQLLLTMAVNLQQNQPTVLRG
jgi:hypothetical protein